MANQYPAPLQLYQSPLQQLRRQPSTKILVSDQSKDPRSNLEEFIKKFYPDSLNNQSYPDLQSQLKESRLPNGDTDFSKISLGNLKFLNLEFATPPQFEPSNPSEYLNSSINCNNFRQNIRDQIAIKDREFQEKQKLKEQAKKTLTEELQKLSLDNIQKKLEDFKKIETTDDSFGAIIPQGQTQDSQPSTDLKFNSKRAKDQISEFLIAEEKLAGLSENTEIQIFYFEKLKIIQQQKQQELKEQAKQVLTNKLQKLSLDDILNKLEDFRNKDVEQTKTTDDDFEEFKLDPTKAQKQISTILTARQNLTKFADDKEIQQFYFYELQEIEFEKEKESKKLQTQQTQLSANSIEPQSLKKSSSLFSIFSSLFSSSSKEKTAPVEDRIKNTTKRTQSLPNILSKANPPKRSVKKPPSTLQNNIYSEQHPSSDFKKNQEFREFFKPTLVDKITSAGLWFFESIKNFDFSSPSQGPEIIGSAIKAYEKFGGNPDEAKNFASFLDRKFNDEKLKNKSLTFDKFINEQNVDQLLTEFEKVKSKSLHQTHCSPQAISTTRRAISLNTSSPNNHPSKHVLRSRSFLTPGQSNPKNDSNYKLIDVLLKELKFIAGPEQKVYGSITEKRTTFFERPFDELTPNQQDIVNIFDRFIQDQQITTALQNLYIVLCNPKESFYYNREKDLEFASALYHRISETKGFNHRKDYGNDGLHGKIQQKLGITVLAPTRPHSRSR